MDEDADLRERDLLLRDDAEVELADLLGLRRVVGLDGVAGVLDDRGRVAAEDGRALLVGVELGDALGASDFRVPTKKSAAALPWALLKVGFQLSSNMSPPNDRNTG